ncbi:MAG: hypothetical protein HC849_01150 [Oscillatoriales cyanobacterium RU_3_3]|nr:hypothetical protein [Microcoleus sp. SU_5_6]NJL68736.1 hypothetical protein [Microcoleus sp. SM1_3_4]NJM59110.1 hypothetical protein [Oscillatoriales cyanobacterium RU_3_3]NJR24804.1 hypothetical protein [Richelia sp. CSU_2_1]
MIDKEMLTADEGTVQLVDEIIEIKEILRDVAKKLTRIETQVKRGVNSANLRSSELQPAAKRTVDLSAEQVIQVYEELRLKAKNGHEAEVRQKLASMSATDLNLMCCELGMPPTSKNPSRKKMFELIIGRIKQSLMLSRHIDRQAL